MEKVKDKYDEEIEYLKANPDEINDHWSCGKPLFQYVTLDGSGKDGSGCLTWVKRQSHYKEVNIDIEVNKQIRDEILADDRIPKNENDITIDHLEVFAEWQRKLDVYRYKYKN